MWCSFVRRVLSVAVEVPKVLEGMALLEVSGGGGCCTSTVLLASLNWSAAKIMSGRRHQQKKKTKEFLAWGAPLPFFFKITSFARIIIIINIRHCANSSLLMFVLIWFKYLHY